MGVGVSFERGTPVRGQELGLARARTPVLRRQVPCTHNLSDFTTPRSLEVLQGAVTVSLIEAEVPMRGQYPKVKHSKR